MNNQYGEDQDEATVTGFEVPRSPDSSYNNAYPGNEDDACGPPVIPPHLHRTLLSYPASMNASGNLPLPENVILNHLYIEDRDATRSVVALGFTQRFRSKYVTVVLYKPVPRRGEYQYLTYESDRRSRWVGWFALVMELVAIDSNTELAERIFIGFTTVDDWGLSIEPES